MNELLKRSRSKPKLPTSFLHNEDDINNAEDIANNFNEFFINVGPNLAKKFDKHSKRFLIT